MNSLLKLSFLLFLAVPIVALGQRTADVHGKFTYTIGDNDHITLREAKHKCLELAKAEAIKEAFGELITSDVIDSNAETNGESTSSFFWENTVAMAKGDWMMDTQPPSIQVEYADGKLTFIAEVWGKAREIVPSNTDLKWTVMKDDNGSKKETASFNSGERVYVNLQAPADGFVAIYLVLGDNETCCLLPYRNDPSGRYPVRSGKEYEFFDKSISPQAVNYKLNTSLPLEYNQLVIIYSPFPFTKCIDNVGDRRHPNSLNTREFQKWLLNCQRKDRDMVVQKKWLEIHSTQAAK